MRIAFADFSGWDFHALTVDQMPMGGSQSAACYLARALVQTGHEVYLANNISVPGKYGGVTSISWATTPLLKLRELKLDVMICVAGAGSGIQLRDALGSEVRLVLWNQYAADQPGVQALRNSFERDAYDGFAMVSDWQRERFVQVFGLDPARTVVLRNAIAPAFLNLFPDNTPILTHKAWPPILTYTSTPFRGLDLLLDAFPAIRNAVPDARLQVFSSMKVYQVASAQDETEYGGLYQRCREMKGVEYIGSLPQPELAQRLRQSLVLAYPNTFAETSCIAVMEAMASGCRIVTSLLGALPETTRGFGRLIPMGDAYLAQFVDAAVQSLRDYSSDSDATESLLRAQVNMVNTADTWKFRAEEWCKWLNALPGSSRSTEIATIPQLLAVAVQHHQAGQLAEAESRYRQILVQQPNHANAIHLLGVVAYQNKLYDDSADLIRRAIALVPKLPQAHNSLGNTLQALGQTDEAIACFRRALVLNPNSVDARFNLGNAHRLRGEFDDAMACYKQTLALQPGHAPAQTDLAAVLLETGHTQEAIAGHRRATNVQPDYVPAHNNLGIALHETGQLDEAIASYRRALTLDPYYAMAHSNLGNVLRDTGKPDEAIASHRRAVALRPDLVAAHGDLVFAMHFHPGYDAAMISREERAWDHLHARPLKAHIRPHENDRSPDRRLRIGYVSADFRDHACAFFLDPLLRCHDHHHFEIICYAQISAPDSFTQRCQTYADRWRSTVGLSDEQVADQIRQDGIDVLVDLKLHTDRNRLLVFARKPAPVQVSWLGYPGSTGISTIEYRLTDRYLEPPDVNDESGGEAIRLPDCFWCYDPLTDQPPVNDLPALRSGHFTFGCLNAFAKINQRVLELWAATMAAVPDSRLLLLAPRGDCRRWALDILDRHGVSSDRVEISDRLPRPQYLQLYHRIDLGLDCFPYNGHTTNLDSLWMGVPMVTLIGQTAVGRAGWSQLCNLDLKELAAKTPEQFVRIAAGFAGDLPKLSRLRSTLRQRMEQSPLMDAPRFARNVESAYRQMWRKWCEAC